MLWFTDMDVADDDDEEQRQIETEDQDARDCDDVATAWT